MVIRILLFTAAVTVGFWVVWKNGETVGDPNPFETHELNITTNLGIWSAEPMSLTHLSDVFALNVRETPIMPDFGLKTGKDVQF
jgi:hypothetical protein